MLAIPLADGLPGLIFHSRGQSLVEDAQLLDDAPLGSQHATGLSDQSLPSQPQLEGGGTLPSTPPPAQPADITDGMLGAATTARGLHADVSPMPSVPQPDTSLRGVDRIWGVFGNR